MATFPNLGGVMNALFRLGGPTGVGLKNSSGNLQLRNVADNGYAGLEAYSLRVSNGAAVGSVLASTDVNGNATWQTLAGISGQGSAQEAFTQATSSPIALATVPANAVITRIGVSVTVAAGGGSPTLSVGITATPALYMATTENSLLAANDYIKDMFVAVGASPVPVTVTIVVSAQTFTGVVWIEWETPA